MQPSEYATPHSSDPPASDAPVAPRAAPARPRARMAIVVPTAVIAALVIIAGTGNQWVTKQMMKADGEARQYFGGWLTYSWRFNSDGWPNRYLAAQFALIGTVLLLTGLLVWALLHGPITWVRAFFGTWLAVVFATIAGAVVRGFVVKNEFGGIPSRASRVTFALFGPYGPSSGVVFAGLLLGLVVAALTSLVAVVSRRTVGAAEPPVAPAGPPAFADYAPPPARAAGGPPPWQDQHYGPPSGASLAKNQPENSPPNHPEGRPDERPYVPPAEPAGEQATARLPAPAEASPESRPEPAADQPTTQLTPPAGPPPEGPPTQAVPAQGPRPEGPPTQAVPAQGPPPEGPPTQAAPAQGPPTQGSPPQAQPAPAEPAGDEQSTTRFPRPPDDEELGHIDHEEGPPRRG